MQVLVLNSGSSSIKYQLFDEAVERRAWGLVEGIGEPTGRVAHRRAAPDGETLTDTHETPVRDHADGFTSIVDALGSAGHADGLGAIGHRVVHGGAAFTRPTLLDDEVVARIADQVPLAPLHNPANLTGIEVARALRGEVPQVAVFDTAFHATLPERAHRYALPTELAETYGIRRYGFHGTSHGYVARRAAEHLRRPIEELAIITLHLGNGASATAVDGGRSVETSMGLTPLEGLVMGTRSGDLDPAVVLHLQRHAGLTVDEVDAVLNRQSGLLGMCGANDVRTVTDRAAAGDHDAELALEVYCHRIRHYVGAYAVALGRLDALVFTAGVGENADTIRARVCDGLGILGIALDPARNDGVRAGETPGGVAALHAAHSAVAVLAVATDEEREIALQTRAVLRGDAV